MDAIKGIQALEIIDKLQSNRKHGTKQQGLKKFNGWRQPTQFKSNQNLEIINTIQDLIMD